MPHLLPPVDQRVLARALGSFLDVWRTYVEMTIQNGVQRRVDGGPRNGGALHFPPNDGLDSDSVKSPKQSLQAFYRLEGAFPTARP